MASRPGETVVPAADGRGVAAVKARGAAARTPSLETIGRSSPVFTMIGGVDTADGAVCGVDGVCVVPGDSSTIDTDH